MTALERAGLLAHARSEGFTRNIIAAQNTIRDGLALCALPYVSFSLGKDSAVCLDLALSIQPGILARVLVWEDETEALHSDYRTVVAAWQERTHVEVITASRSATIKAVAERWEALWAGRDASIVGLRKDESAGRRMDLNVHGPVYFYKNQRLRICPVANWSTTDIAAYVVTHDLPILRAYEAHGLDSRTTLRVPRDTHRPLMLNDLRQRDPDGYMRLLARFPELKGWCV